MEREANRVLWWILGSIFAILMMTTSIMLKANHDTLQSAEKRIAQLEVEVASLRAVSGTSNNRLDRIENKIDFLIQRDAVG